MADVSTDGLVELALDAWEATAGTRRDMMRNALAAVYEALQRSNAEKDEALANLEKVARHPNQDVIFVADLIAEVRTQFRSKALSHSSETSND